MRRYSNRKDGNHQEIIKYLRAKGWVVLDISNLPNCCDCFISKDNVTIAVEIKDGSRPPSQQKLTEGEEKFLNDWAGLWAIVRSVKDADMLSRFLF